MYMENVHELHKMEFCREEFFYRENFGESHQQLDPWLKHKTCLSLYFNSLLVYGT